MPVQDTPEPAAPAISLHDFTDIDHSAEATYVAALEAFDRLPLLRELKALAIERTRTGPGRHVLDVGCGFGLETLRLARLVQPGGAVTGIDLSDDFIAEARRRAAAAGLEVDLVPGNAEALPFPDDAVDVARAERVLIYLDAPDKALAELVRVTRPGGRIAVIEPDFDTNTVNVPDAGLVRAVLAHEADTAVVNPRLVRDLRGDLTALGLTDVLIESRMVVFSPDLAVQYFAGIGTAAATAGAIDAAAGRRWTDTVEALHREGRLFGAIGYYLVTATVPPASSRGS
ncbi:methyltransferase domain-containing protein [Actinomycetospora aeridis]|uniref:Methyltransferase domain-containing protein n=1 Tax=Actinomycetospora aeridis TaxID=3129231 RepID=A0ABU8N1T9_9PSEU